jgi:outer membrane lipoprotein SlyB
MGALVGARVGGKVGAKVGALVGAKVGALVGGKVGFVPWTGAIIIKTFNHQSIIISSLVITENLSTN